MARLIYAARALADLERLTGFLVESDPPAALATIELIEEAVTALRHHPLIGRPLTTELRELVISRGRSGYVALYSFERVYDAVLILAVRHQREAGYTPDGDARARHVRPASVVTRPPRHA